jgi:F420-non-reducing hydrogenase iron-sulfur subunit
MCSGRVDLEFVLRAFANGMDGVFIGGCRLHECNYITHGNYHALNMVHLVGKILEHLGVNPDRLNIEFMSAGEGMLFAEVVDKFTKKVKSLGPLGSSEGMDGEELKAKIQAVSKLVPYIKIAMREKLARQFDKIEQYTDLYTRGEIDQLFREAPSYYIDPAKCQACMTCAKRCPVEAIDGGKNLIHIIDQDKCIKCGTCLEACPSKFSAVTKLSGQAVPPPIAEEKRTIVRKGKEKAEQS